MTEAQPAWSWSRIARRIRVPLGFLFAAFYLWRAHPDWPSLVGGGAVAAVGLFVRAMASGHVKKNEQLASTGPYAYCRNPLYLGSIIIATGFAIASRDVWISAGIVVLFVVIYVPVIRSEEDFLRQHFAEDHEVHRGDFRILPRALLAASRVQCIYRGRRNAGGPCCEDALVPRFMVTSLIRCLILLAVLTAAVMPGPSRYSSVWAQSTHGATAQNEPQASIGAGAHIQPLRPGFDFPRQTLRYEAEYRFWTAGVASLRVERNGSQEHLSATADSSGVVALLFRVQDRFNSYFDAQTLCSARVTKHTEEGSHWRETTITFDYSRGKSVLEEKNLKTGQSKRVENDIPGCVTDVVSGVLYVASLPLQPDATYSFPLSDGGKTVTIQAHVEGKEQIKTPAGTFQTIRVGPQGDYSALKNRGRVLIWYSDDARHLPIQMQARMLWGTLTVYLTSIDK